MKKKAFLTVLCLLFALSSCTGGKKEEEVASVNGAPILLKDFQKEVSLAAKRDPSLKLDHESLEELLETMIHKKLMVQEAVKKGLSEDQQFLDTIKTYWEQTLIRQLIDSKNREWADRLFVTDDEVLRHYGRMGSRVTFRMAVLQHSDDKRADEAKKEMMRGARVDGEELIGPLLIENISWDNPLFNAFDQPVNEVSLTKGDDDFTVIEVVKRETVPAPALKEVYEQIKDMLLEQKRERILDEWLHDIKKSARIEVRGGALKKANDER